MEYRGYKIEGDKTFGLKVIKTIGPGKLPTVLVGSYTSPVQAQRQIDSYLCQKEKLNGRSKATASE